jgi:dihydrolipoamide dehydrogenase
MPTPNPNHYDVAILGGGPGGMAAAMAAASRGMTVLLIDGGNFLGYGLQGAFKSKALWEGARDWLSAGRMGWTGTATGQQELFEKIHARVQDGVQYLTAMYLKYMELKGVRFVRGFATFVDAHTVTANGERFTARHIILATGSTPRTLPDLRVDGRTVMTSDEVVDGKESFKSLLVVGGGVIGCEFASIFSSLGVKVTLLDRAERILSTEDADIAGLLAAIYQSNGVEVRSGAKLQSLQVVAGEVRGTLEDGSLLAADRVLLSIGRLASTRTLDLDAAGVQTDKNGAVPVNGNLQTNVPHVYAVGDVGQRNTPLDLSLVHVAEAEGRMAITHLCGGRVNIRPNHIPFIIFSMPMVAGAGFTETQAREQFGEVRVASFQNLRNHRYQAMQSHEGFLKLVVGPTGDDRILGVRAIGNQADNVIGEVSVLIDNNIPYTYLLESTHAHPSLAESLQNAARVIAGVLPSAI